MTKDSKHITHALYCSKVHVIYSIYWTGKLPLKLKLYTDQHSRLEVHHLPTRSIVYYWLVIVRKTCISIFTLHAINGHTVPKFNQSTAHMVFRTLCSYDELTVITGTVILSVTLKNQLTWVRKPHQALGH